MGVRLKIPNLSAVDLKRDSRVRFDKILGPDFCDGSLAIDTVCPLPDGFLGLPYLQVITASGGDPPYTFSIAGGSLPPGLSLAADGTISGIPTN
jgi:Putative Ig domain